MELWVYAGLRGADLEDVPAGELIAIEQRIVTLPRVGTVRVDYREGD